MKNIRERLIASGWFGGTALLCYFFSGTAVPTIVNMIVATFLGSMVGFFLGYVVIKMAHHHTSLKKVMGVAVVMAFLSLFFFLTYQTALLAYQSSPYCGPPAYHFPCQGFLSIFTAGYGLALLLGFIFSSWIAIFWFVLSAILLYQISQLDRKNNSFSIETQQKKKSGRIWAAQIFLGFVFLFNWTVFEVSLIFEYKPHQMMCFLFLIFLQILILYAMKTVEKSRHQRWVLCALCGLILIWYTHLFFYSALFKHIFVSFYISAEIKLIISITTLFVCVAAVFIGVLFLSRQQR